jgi:NAD(P)-dependent dehydrogenase (short-subunit alcohol dehydrogenase family)
VRLDRPGEKSAADPDGRSTNLKGCFLCTLRATGLMRGAGDAIVNIGSGCNKWPFPNFVDYTASKGGIEMLPKVGAVELGPFRIRVNCVAPGAIEIERTKTELGDYAGTWSKLTPLEANPGTPFGVNSRSVSPSFIAQASRKMAFPDRPLGRIGPPRDVGKPVVPGWRRSGLHHRTNTRSHSNSDNSNRSFQVWVPAFFTTMSRRPNPRERG